MIHTQLQPILITSGQLKDLVEIRPIFHFRKRRVKTHVQKFLIFNNICSKEIFEGEKPFKKGCFPSNSPFPKLFN